MWANSLSTTNNNNNNNNNSNNNNSSNQRQQPTTRGAHSHGRQCKARSLTPLPGATHWLTVIFRRSAQNLVCSSMRFSQRTATA